MLLLIFSSSLLGFNFDKIDTFQADFSQSIFNQSGKEIKYTGKVFLKKPFKILWEYSEPIQKNVYLIDNNVTIIEPDLEQAIFSKIDKEINILKIIQSGKEIAPNTYESILYNRPYQFLISNNQLSSIQYTDDVDNKIVINFSNISQNQPIKDAIYRFDIPSEYDIIRK